MLVLSALALIAFLALAILTFVRSEGRAAQSVGDVAELRTLQGLPEKLVINQLRNATRDLMANDLGYTWASQPGMIRVYGTSVSAGSSRADVAEFYKLYSSDLMEVRDPTWNPATDADAAMKGLGQTGLWTDLNEPVSVRERRSLSQPGSGTDTRLVFPILDPAAFQRGYDGLSLVGVQLNAQAKRMPMPVRWLYVLQDGSVVAPLSGGQDGTVITVPGAREDNPIIGRIAFWTDDESSKLNINVASEPAPWERPITTSQPDQAHAAALPARGEHYRESAHPSFTSLSPVLRHFGQTTSTPPNYVLEPQDPFSGNGNTWANAVKRIHQLLPRTPIWEPGNNEGSMAGTTETESEVQLRRERLFANVDELFFSADSQADGERLRNGQNGTLSVTQEDIETSRFLLTTRSRAPETNPFGWPKISLWPVSESETERHQVDQRMSLAATIDPGNANLPYYLQRAANWQSDTNPGSSQSAIWDMQVTRNQELFDYLLTMTDNVMPGVGGAFVDKYGAASRSQILVSMFDMLRWGVNPMSPYDQNLEQELTPEYSYLPPSEEPGNSPNGVGAFSAVPLQHEVDGLRHRGIGRFPTLTEVALVFFATKAKMDDTPPVDNKGFYKKTEEFRAFIVVEPKVLAPGMPGVSPTWRMRISGHQGVTLNVGNIQPTLNFAKNPTEPDWSPTVRVCASPALGGNLGNHGPYAGLAAQFLQSNRDPRDWRDSDAEDDGEGQYFVLGSAAVDVSAAIIGNGNEHQEMELPEIPLTIEIYDDTSPSLADDGALVQVLQLRIPKQPIPLPRLHQDDATASLESRFTLAELPGSGSSEVPFLKKGDVVRSAQSRRDAGVNGDTRLQASLSVPGEAFFESPLPDVPSPLLLDPSWYQVHNLRDDAFMAGEYQPGFRGEDWTKGRATLDPAVTTSLVRRPVESSEGMPSLQYGQKGVPAVEGGVLAAVNGDLRPGDFDNGPGITEDGPYINLPDFGSGTTQLDAGDALGSTVVGGYFQRGGRFFEDDGTTFSPLRQMGSAIGFGSLPSAVFGDTLGGVSNPMPRAWTTLLFCPNPPSRTTDEDKEPDYVSGSAATSKKDHFGFATPRDHLWLEYFWMPAAEQPGLSDGFSTEGKVNMNYQIQPFHWIKRATAMHGALHGVRVTAIPSSAVTEAAGTDHYKHYENGTGSGLSFRYAVDAEQTLRQFDERFARGELFITPSEICEQFLVPRRLNGHTYEGGNVSARDPATVATTYTGVMDWWEGQDAEAGDAFEATGDNTRESPYAQLYPRLCTRSNVFKVHYRVQVLQKAASTRPNVWDEAKDRVGADYRGEATIERYLDPRRTGMVDFATSSGLRQTLFDYHDFRVTGRRQFAP